MEQRDLPIGVFDSGVGGLTVVRQLRNLMPNESICYLGDTARVPYGNKSPETVVRYACEDAQFLIDRGVKAIVVACNTATAWALTTLQRTFSVPVMGVIEPGSETALIVSHSKRIGVIGTHATIRSRAYNEAMKDRLQHICVFSKSCPLLVPLVEEGWANHPIAEQVLEEYLTPLVKDDVDTIILGCTHYPVMKRTIVRVLKRISAHHIRLVDSAESCALHVRRRLMDLDLLTSSANLGTITPFVTDSPGSFMKMVRLFLGIIPEKATQVTLKTVSTPKVLPLTEEPLDEEPK